MIDVKGTIYKNINQKIDRLRILADNDTVGFKKLLRLIIIDDLSDWANYLGAPEEIQKKLQECKKQFIHNNPELCVIYNNSEMCDYVNVNLPQTNNTWKRIWDSKKACIIDDFKRINSTAERPSSFTPDNTYDREFIVLPTKYVGINIDGSPNVYDWESFSICDMMNFYINPESGDIYYLDSNTCEWKKFKVAQDEELTDAQLDAIKEAVKENQLTKVTHNILGDQIEATVVEDDAENIHLATDQEDLSWMK